MSIEFTRMRTAIALGAFYTGLALLTACSSGSDSNDDAASGTNNAGGTEANDSAAAQSPADNANQLGAEVVGTWVLCVEAGGLRSEYEFTATTYTNKVGGGNCAGFLSEDQILVNAGPYSITGTATSDSGLTSYNMELSTETVSGEATFESIRATRYRLAYTGTPNQIAFSSDSSGDQERSLTLDLERPYVRMQ